MRQIGRIATQELTDRFVDYLLTIGVHASGEEDSGEWIIWATEEDKLDLARQTLLHFNAAPDDPRYADQAQRAAEIREAERNKSEVAEQNTRRGRELWGPGFNKTARRAPITVTLIALSVAISLFTSFGDNESAADLFGFVKHEHLGQIDEEGRKWDYSRPVDALIDIRAGEVWRLVTPIFIHLGVIHLLFNMMWLYQLGGQIESIKGRAFYIVLILVLAVFSCLVQALIERYPFFGGMSGVVYGVFGYIWMRTKYWPSDGFMLNRNTVAIMMIWFVICFAGTNVANGGHAGGLLMGVAIGYFLKKP
jgi:GlpG protein